MLEQTQPVIIHPMEYRTILGAGVAPSEPKEDVAPAFTNKELEMRICELKAKIEQQSCGLEAAVQAARAEACEQGRASERNEQSARIQAAAQALTAALAEFAGERDRYLAQVEQEIVRLALAIAARVLHREALMDPLLLTGAVRVALGQLADTTEVRLKIPAQENEMWSEMLRLMPNLPLHPEVIADKAMAVGECLLETDIGSVDLGVRSQLAEIERGFFDLLGQREQASEHSSFKGQRSAEPQNSRSTALDANQQAVAR
jgi:flagellar assembly protein FliH